MAGTVYENLASSIQRDSIVPKTAADTTPLTTPLTFNIRLFCCAKHAHIIISLSVNPYVKRKNKKMKKINE